MPRLALLLIAITLCALGQPARIVSTSPSVTEILFAIGAGPQVVGVSLHCRYPEAVNALPRVGTYRTPDAERIARLKPDLVFLHDAASDIANRLDALGIRHVTIPYGTLADTFAAMHLVGKSVGRQQQAESLVSRIHAAIQRSRTNTSALQRRAVIIVGRDSDSLTNLIAAGPSSYLGELLEAAGGRNMLEGGNIPPYPRISLETIMRLDPDIIIDAAAPADRPGQAAALRERVLLPWRMRKDLKAVKQDAVYPIFTEAFTLPGPRMIEVLAFLESALRGARP